MADRRQLRTSSSVSSVYRRELPAAIAETTEAETPAKESAPCSPEKTGEMINESSSPTKLNDSEISEITTSMSVQDMIQDIMSEYRSALETLTAEVTSLRSEVADQQKQFNTKIKLLNHNQVTIKQDFEQQMTTQNKHYQQQQNQHKNQVKQQIEQLAKETVPDTPKINIQYETLSTTTQKNKTTKPKNKQKSNAQPEQSNTIQVASKLSNAAAGASTMQQRSSPAPASSISESIDSTIVTTPTQITECSPENTSRKPKDIDSIILGSSIVKHIRGGNIRRYSKKFTKVCSYPGADSEKITDHAEVELKYFNPKSAIIYAGGNDLSNGQKISSIVAEICHLGNELKHRGVKHIAISSVLPRINLMKEVPELNRKLKEMAAKEGFDFIFHRNIYYKYHMARDKVHLNYDGVEILEENFTFYLKNLKLDDKD